MTHKIYSRKTKVFISKNSQKVEAVIKKISNSSADSLAPFEQSPSFKNPETKNAAGVLNAFDLFQAYTSSIIRKKIIFER